MRAERTFVRILVGMASATGASKLEAALIDVPNASFESPHLDFVSPFATSTVDVWQKTPVPAYWSGLGYSAQQWTDSAGTFLNVPFAPIDNVDQAQAVFLFASPEVELFQDLSSTFDVGQSYQLKVGIEGGGFGMKIDVPIEIRLYYRDASGARVTVGATETKNANATGNITHLIERQLDIPAVTAGNAWAGKNIGVQLISTVGLLDAGGYWDIDNVRLTSVPEPATLAILGLGAFAFGRRRTGIRG